MVGGVVVDDGDDDEEDEGWMKISRLPTLPPIPRLTNST
jgi:hypothetical protein